MNWFKQLFAGEPETVRKCDKCGKGVLKKSQWMKLVEDYDKRMGYVPDAMQQRVRDLTQIVSNAGLRCGECGAVFCASCLDALEARPGLVVYVFPVPSRSACSACGGRFSLSDFTGHEEGRTDNHRANSLLPSKQNPVSTGPASADDFESALEKADIEIFRQWLKSGLDVDRDFGDGFRPLHLIARLFSDQAARGSDTSFLLAVARLFLESKANPNVRATPVGTTGITPLHIACAPVDKPLATLLFAHGADGTIKDNFGRTPAERQKLEVENLRANGYPVTEESDKHVDFLRYGNRK